jgi:hypothetical protein
VKSLKGGAIQPSHLKPLSDGPYRSRESRGRASSTATGRRPDSARLRGDRPAAAEFRLEQAAVRRLLSYPASLSSAIRRSRVPTAELQQLLSAAARHATLVDDDAAETLTILIDRVELLLTGWS